MAGFHTGGAASEEFGDHHRLHLVEERNHCQLLIQGLLQQRMALVKPPSSAIVISDLYVAASKFSKAKLARLFLMISSGAKLWPSAARLPDTVIAISFNPDELSPSGSRICSSRSIRCSVSPHIRRLSKAWATDLCELYVHERNESLAADAGAKLADASGVFFTGGDQLRIASQIGDTPIERAVLDLHLRGGLIAGTSAGASVMSETMLVKGSGAESHRIGDLHMAPGLGLIRDVIIDQHFAERGRIGRLLGAVAQNPRLLGIGIDEDTAIIVEGRRFHVVGDGAVTVVDGTCVTHSNIAEARPELTLSMHDVRLHMLSAGDRFDLDLRRAEGAAKDDEG